MSKIKGCSRAFALLLTAVIAVFCFPVSAFAADETVPKDEWHKYYDFNKCSDFSINYNGSDKEHYAFKIVNKDYSYASIARTYSVKPNTEYKFSAAVKCEGYKPKKSADPSGAGLYLQDISYKFSESDKWTNLQLTVNSGDRTELTLHLMNGYNPKYSCKGTAYFSDVKLEEATKTEYSNEWNVLAVIVKNVDAPAVDLNGKKVQVKRSYSKKAVSALKKTVKEAYNTITEWSDGNIKFKDIDFAVVSTPVTKFSKTDLGYAVDADSPQLVSFIENRTKKKVYNQIIVIAPTSGTNINSAGGYYNGTRAKYGNSHTVGIAPSGTDSFRTVGFIHEFIHGIEGQSKKINGDKTPKLDGYEYYGYCKPGDEKHDAMAWNKRYLQTYKKPFKKDGKCIDKQAFTVINKIEYKDVTGKFAVNEKIPVGKDKNIYIK